MPYLVGILVAALIVGVSFVMVPVWLDRPWEHPGATEDWSPLAELDTIPVAPVLTPAATGWPA